MLSHICGPLLCFFSNGYTARFFYWLWPMHTDILVGGDLVFLLLENFCSCFLKPAKGTETEVSVPSGFGLPTHHFPDPLPMDTIFGSIL